MRLSFNQYRRTLGRYLRLQRGSVSVLAVLLFGSIGLDLLQPQLVRNFIDHALGGSAVFGLLRIAGWFLVVGLARGVVSTGATYMSERVAWKAANKLRADLLEYTLHRDMPFHIAHPPGEMVSRIDGDVTALANFFGRFVLELLGSVLLLVGTLILFWREDWHVGLLLTIFSAIAAAVLYATRNVNVQYEVAQSESSARLLGATEEWLTGLEDIRANGSGSFVMNRWRDIQRDQADRERLAGAMGSRLWIITTLLFTVGYALALGAGVILVHRGEISVGTVFLLYQYTEMLRSPLERLSRQTQDLNEASAGLLRVMQLMPENPEIVDSGEPLPDGALSVVYDDVMFAYDGTDPTLKDINFRLAPGTILGLLGRTGSGKTTLTRLLLRLYGPSRGKLLVGDRRIEGISRQALRGHIGVVPQDVHLFDAPVRDNVTLWDDSVPDARVIAVLGEVGLAEWLGRLPRGIYTPLRADGLSAGEAQCLALARVFLQDPGLVILDEASSRLDPASEHAIERALDRLLQGRTAIIIAHRLQTVRRADEIMILERGRVIEHGSREALEADEASRFSSLLRHGMEEVLV